METSDQLSPAINVCGKCEVTGYTDTYWVKPLSWQPSNSFSECWFDGETGRYKNSYGESHGIILTDHRDAYGEAVRTKVRLSMLKIIPIKGGDMHQVECIPLTEQQELQNSLSRIESRYHQKNHQLSFDRKRDIERFLTFAELLVVETAISSCHEIVDMDAAIDEAIRSHNNLSPSSDV